MEKLHFPHISRLFSANKSVPFILTLCWSMLAAGIIINALISKEYASITQKVTDTMTKTNDNAANRSLSDWFRKSGYPSVAQDLLLSKNLPVISSGAFQEKNGVLGAHIKTLSYWEHILAEKPDYRDAYLAAAKSALLENNIEKALGFIRQALRIDPNDRTALVLLTLIGKNSSR